MMAKLTLLVPCVAPLAAACCAAAQPGATTPGAAATPPAVTPQEATPPRRVTLGPEWAPLRALVGAWSGTGGDAAHPSRGGFTLAADLDGKILVRRGTNDTATEHHEDLTIIYRVPGGGSGGELQASYFDNEGHAIHYAIAPSADGRSIVFLGDDVPGMPRFQLTYDAVAADTLSVTFAIAAPGTTQFRTYVKGEVHRTGG